MQILWNASQMHRHVHRLGVTPRPRLQPSCKATISRGRERQPRLGDTGLRPSGQSARGQRSSRRVISPPLLGPSCLAVSTQPTQLCDNPVVRACSWIGSTTCLSTPLPFCCDAEGISTPCSPDSACSNPPYFQHWIDRKVALVVSNKHTYYFKICGRSVA